LPPAGVRSLEQGPDGYLWLGTEMGLVRFDGLRFVPFETLHKGSLASSAVSALMRAQDGSLWVGLSGRTSIARIHDGGIQTFDQTSGLPDSVINSLYQDKDGAIWAGSTAGLFRFDGHRWNRIALPETGNDAVSAIREDDAGRMWAAGRFAV